MFNTMLKLSNKQSCQRKALFTTHVDYKAEQRPTAHVVVCFNNACMLRNAETTPSALLADKSKELMNSDIRYE
jgi:NADH:ubiquinone oxidoreductase subunit E